MSHEIESLIANISEKFDSQFLSRPDEEPRIESEDPHNNKQSPSMHEQEVESNPEVVSPQTHKQSSPHYQDQQEQTYSPNQQQQFSTSAALTDQDKDQNHDKYTDRIDEENAEYPGDEQYNEDDDNKYRQLSSKLEAALKKISSEKKNISYNSSHSRLLQRFEIYQKKREKDIEHMRQAELERVYEGVTGRPQINVNSRNIAIETGQRPIYERFQGIVDQKKKRLQQNEEKKRQKEEEEYEQFLEQYREHSRTVAEPRDSEAYFKDMQLWKERIEKNRASELQRKQEKELEGYTFKPVLNKKSVRMAKNQKRQPIQERQVVRVRTQGPEYSFRPKINKRRPIS